MKFWQVVMFVKNRCSDFLQLVFFSYLFCETGLCVCVNHLWPSEYADLLIPIFKRTCTDINFNQGKLRWNTNKRGVVRHDISFMDVAEKINVWASSLSITTFHCWGATSCATTEHEKFSLATSFSCPQFVCATLLIKPWRPDHFQGGILHDPFSGHISPCTFVYFLLINILNFYNVWLTWRKVGSPGLCSLKEKVKAKECTCKLESTKRLN